MAFHPRELHSGLGLCGTTFDHNWDRQLTTMHRPDGGDVVLSYHPTNGRLVGITQPGRSPMSFAYWDVAQGPAAASGQLQSVTSPDSVTCSYDYAGPFLARETWSGAVSGSLARTFDADFHERTETVTVGSAVSTERASRKGAWPGGGPADQLGLRWVWVANLGTSTCGSWCYCSRA